MRKFLKRLSAICLLFAVFYSGCDWHAGGKPMEKTKIPKDPVLSKHNFRSSEKDGFKVEVWMDGSVSISSPIGAGFRVYLPKEAKDEPPEVTARLVLRKKDEKDVLREETARPALKKTAIEGGYWENIRVDSIKTIERNEKFVGMKGIWEIDLKDPLKMRSAQGITIVTLEKGEYTLSIELSIKNGPTFQFENLPYRRVFREEGFKQKGQ